MDRSRLEEILEQDEDRRNEINQILGITTP